MEIIHKITKQEAIEAYRQLKNINSDVEVQIEELQLAGGTLTDYTPKASVGILGIAPNSNAVCKPCPDGLPGCLVCHY